MKLIRNLILVIIFIVAVAFCLYIAPNYKKSGYEDRINLVINFKNVTSTMKGEVIKENNNIYISIDDINNYYDRYIYYDKKYNYIIASKNGYLACFDINRAKLDINGNVTGDKVIKKDNLYYVPINVLQELYNIKVDYNEKTNIVTIDSLDNELKQASVNKKADVKSKPTMLSRTLEKVDNNSTVYVKENNEENNKESTSKSKSKSIVSKINNYIEQYETQNEKNWTYIKTENGTLGYIHNNSLNEIVTARAKKAVEQEPVSLVWDYYENLSAVPKNNVNTNYKGINVVSPAFFFVKEDGNIKELVSESGQNYIEWAKSKGYQIWPMVKCDNLLTDNMRNLLSDYKKREALINEIVQVTKKYKLDGINIDFENIKKEDKDYFSRFIIELKPRLEAINAKLSVDVTAPDGSPNWSLCYDRNTIGNVADYIIFMAYDQTSKKGSTIGSNAAYNWVENNIVKFIKNEGVDSNKIILAIPFYARLWKINADGVKENGYDISIKDQDKYINKAPDKEWLPDAKQHYIEYSEKGYTYKMWIEDDESISEKLDLIKKYKLAGAAFWEKGMEYESVWAIVEDKLF